MQAQAPSERPSLVHRLWRQRWLRLLTARVFFRQVPHGRRLGFRVVDIAGNTLVAELPYSEAVIGDPATRGVHGGAILALVDQASGTIASLSIQPPDLVATLDLRLDHLRPAQPGQPVRAVAECYRVTPQIVFVRCSAYDDDPTQAIATSTSTFMRTAPLVANPLQRLRRSLRHWR